MRNISVVGSGYVGLVAGTCFADSGNKVICVDNDKSKIDSLEKGVIPIYEPGLEDMVKRNYLAKRLTFSTDLSFAVKNTEIIFIAVGTPSSHDGKADLQYVLKVAEEIAISMQEYKVIVLKSTVPVGTADKVENLIKSKTKVPFDIVNNPEFLKEGAALDDFFKPDRVVIGLKSEKAEMLMKELYEPFVRQGNPIVVMDNKSAEITKYAANSFLALKISFVNDLAKLAEIVGADINSIRKGFMSDSRIGSRFFYPGVGYGGSCFPKDVRAIINTAKEAGHRLEILEKVEEVNDKQKKFMFEKAQKHFNGNLKGKVIAIWGLAFKPQTDDMREAPSITIINELLKEGAIVKGYDPVATETAKVVFEDRIEFGANQYSILQGADALILVTEWNEFRLPDFNFVKTSMKTPVIFDGRNIWDRNKLRGMGFTYYGVGV